MNYSAHYQSPEGIVINKIMQFNNASEVLQYADEIFTADPRSTMMIWHDQPFPKVYITNQSKVGKRRSNEKTFFKLEPK